MKNISRLVALLLALMLCFTAVFAIAEETEPGDGASAGGYIGKELNADMNAYNQMAQSAATVALVNEFMGTQSVEEMYALVLEIVNGGESARFDTLMSLSFDQLDQLRGRVYELDPELDDVDTQDMLDMLSALPNAMCPDCSLIGEHVEDCPRYQVEVLLPNDEYIYFDLYYGNVTITGDTYSGYIRGSNGAASAVTGTHDNTKQYYIFQSKGDAYPTNGSIPDYSRVTYGGQSWGEFITNHPKESGQNNEDSVDSVISAWGSVEHLANTVTSGAAYNAGRQPTEHYIDIQSTTNGSTYNVVIDDLWSSFSSRTDPNTTEEENAITAMGTAVAGFMYKVRAINNTLNLELVGDNRFGRIQCATYDGTNGIYQIDKNHTNKMTISTLSGVNDATLTCANITAGADHAYTSAMIGGTDGTDHTVKLVFEQGTIYAGNAEGDFGTGIGGGGNGDGYVTITGGSVTAVASSTGAAIGGGCGTSGPGGYGNVTISGGKVYAYNYQPCGDLGANFSDAMPTAIGGGSSGYQIGGLGIVKISAGTVYAYSEVGNAIGGGGGGRGYGGSIYYSATGGIADVTISGGTVDAISGTGCAIGGGPGGGRGYTAANAEALHTDSLKLYEDGKVSANGGTAKLTISGGTVRAGSIGGGSPLVNNGTDYRDKYGFTVGAAVVNISGGTIHGQVVMNGVIKANTDGFAGNVHPTISGLEIGKNSSFTMTGGTIDNTYIGSAYHFVEKNGGAVYINSGSAKMSGGVIRDASSPLGGAIYLQGGDFELSGTGKIENCSATEFGGAVYISNGDAAVSGGTIENCFAPNGGAAYVTGGSLTMSGGTMSDNGKNAEGTVVTTNGGAAYVNGGEFTMTSGTLASNTAKNDGGAVYVTGGQVIIGSDKCVDTHIHPVLSNNKATNGGAVAVAGSTPTMYCGTMTGNTATANGGAVYVSGGGFTMNGGSIGAENAANTAVNGGAVYVSGGSFTMYNGTMTYNTTPEGNGGAAYISGGSFTMHNGTMSNNTAPKGNGGAVYVTKTGATEANFLMEHGYVNSNSAINGGAVYVNGGSFTMRSGDMNGNKATYSSNANAEAGTEGYGGAVYVTGGNAVIGVEGCYQGTPCSAHAANSTKWHPEMTENHAAFGGAVAVKGGNVTFHCCDIAMNEAMSQGTGQNVFMGAGETEDEGKITYHYDGADIGAPEDHGMVSIGGDLEIIQKDNTTLKVCLNYNSNYDTELVWKGEAPDNFYLNLPYCPESWQEAQSKKNLSFVGWTEQQTGAGDVRKKPDYHDIGYPVYLDKDSGKAEHDEETNTYTLHFWAVWAPKVNAISYAYTLNDTDDSVIQFAENTDFKHESAPVSYDYSMGSYSVSIGEGTLQGYRFLGWRLYADKADANNAPMNVNWHADPSTYDANPWSKPTKLGDLPKYSDYADLGYNGTGKYPTHIDSNSYLVNNTLNIDANFGNITLVAVFEPAYSGLKIVKDVVDGDAVDQQFIFSIVGETDLEEEVYMQIAIDGEGSAIIHLPVGTYTVTELESWSWRYDVTSVGQSAEDMPMAMALLAEQEVNPYAVITVQDPDKGIVLTFTNDRVNTQWLDASDIEQNELK